MGTGIGVGTGGVTGGFFGGVVQADKTNITSQELARSRITGEDASRQKYAVSITMERAR